MFKVFAIFILASGYQSIQVARGVPSFMTLQECQANMAGPRRQGARMVKKYSEVASVTTYCGDREAFMAMRAEVIQQNEELKAQKDAVK